MPKTLADAHIKLTFLTTRPEDLKALTVAELAAGIDAECHILKSDFKLGPVASDTVSGEAPLCASGNAAALGASNYEGTVTVFRYLDSDGKSDISEEVLFEALKEKGTTVWPVRRDGPIHTQEWAAGDEYSAFEALTDNPQDPSDMSGYLKKTIPLLIQQGVLNGKVVAA